MKDITYLIIDLDNTIYPESAGIFKRVDELINRYLEEKMGFAKEEVNPLRIRYYKEYGTTLRGLMVNYKINPSDYLQYVHNINLNGILTRNKNLKRILKRIKQKKVIFTNASLNHAENVLNALEIRDSFVHIFDIVAMEYIAKPHPSTYKKVLNLLKIDGKKCLYIDDIKENLLPAKELGMKTVLVSSDGHKKKLHIDFVVREICEIEKLF